MFAFCVFVKLYLTAKFILDFIDQLFYSCAMMAAHVINGISFALRCKNKILLEFNPSKRTEINLTVFADSLLSEREASCCSVVCSFASSYSALCFHCEN